MEKSNAIDDQKPLSPLVKYTWLVILWLFGIIPMIYFNFAVCCFHVTLVPFRFVPAIDLNYLLPSNFEKGTFNILLILIWGIFHSFLAQPKAYKIQENIFPVQTHRANFTVLAGSSICFCLIFLWQDSGVIVWDISFLPFWIKTIFSSFCTMGFIAVLSSPGFDMLEFLGAKQLFMTREECRNLSGENKTEYLMTDDVYGLVRHPMYTQFPLSVFSPNMTLDHLLFLVAVFGYLVLVGIPKEEEKLLQKFGDKYLQYQKTTPAFIPRPASLFQFMWGKIRASTTKDKTK